MTSDQEQLRTIGDVIAGSTVIATIAGLLPAAAAAFAILWYCILIYDRFRKKKNDVSPPR